MRQVRLGLAGRFALASLVPIAALGAVIAHNMEGQVRRQAIDSAAAQTALIAELCVGPQLPEHGLEGTLSAPERAKLRRVFTEELAPMHVSRLRLLDREGRVAWASDESSGTRPAHEAELHAALGGTVATRMEQERAGGGDGASLAVYVPIKRHADEAAEPKGAEGDSHASAEIEGAFEVVLPYTPIEQAVGRDMRKLYLVLLLGLAALYIVLTSILRRARRHEYHALHDGLTGLPNRMLFRDRGAHALRAARRHGDRVAVAIIDLNRFKHVNDTLGHPSGDVLLRQVGDRLGAALRGEDSVARLSGDEFAVLLPRVESAEAAQVVAATLIESLRRPFDVDGLSLEVGASIGLAVSPDHGEDVDTLVRRADVAMYAAKGSRSGVVIYSPTFDGYSPARLTLVGELRSAIEKGELELHYQPQVDPAAGRVIATEALVRWRHPRRGLLVPSQFVPLAEETSLIQPLTAWVIRQALEQRQTWFESGVDVAMALNVSPWDLLDTRLPDVVLASLEATSTPAGRLVLELTETAIVDQLEQSAVVLSRLKDIGVALSLDDFGNGSASLARLRQLPIDQLKIDRSFVIGMDGDHGNAAIVRSAIELAGTLGLEVVAEGVESPATLAALRRAGCDLVQGFLVGRPVTADELGHRLRRDRLQAVGEAQAEVA